MNLKIIKKQVKDLIPYINNARTHDESQVEQIAASIKEFGFNNPILLDGSNGVIAGHGRLMAAKKLGLKEVPCIELAHLSEAQKKAYILADNKIALNAGWDEELLKIELSDLDDNFKNLIGFSDDELNNLLDSIDDTGESYEKTDETEEKKESVKLSDKFIVPPFSILDTRQGYWQERSKKWGLLFDSQQGRKENLMNSPKLPDEIKTGCSNYAQTTSKFDPVLCEIIVSWFSDIGDSVLDPFAGGAVRGIITEKLKRKYTGIDIRQEQIDDDKKQSKKLGLNPNFICDDSINISKILKKDSFDFVFSCPPYYDLEKYSDKDNDLSNMSYNNFLKAYRDIISQCCSCLKKDSFAVFVVGDVRDKEGKYRCFVRDTITAFIDCSLSLYNELILIEQSGTAAIRAEKTFTAKRKVIKTHQNILVFYKGDINKIKPIKNFIVLDELENDEKEQINESKRSFSDDSIRSSAIE